MRAERRPLRRVARLIQHDHDRDPWRVLVCCILLNRTGGKQVRGVLDRFFGSWPDARSLAGADPAEVRETIRPLGFYNRRSESVVRFSREYLERGWTDPRELHGIGRYGWEAWQIVCNGRRDVEATDGVLAAYLRYERDRERTGKQTRPPHACMNESGAERSSLVESKRATEGSETDSTC